MHAAGSVAAGDAQKVVGKMLEVWHPNTKQPTVSQPDPSLLMMMMMMPADDDDDDDHHHHHHGA
eukprot:1495813-Rhodomonas_salina.1